MTKIARQLGLAGSSVQINEQIQWECQLCSCRERRKTFSLPVLDGPYKTEPGWPTRTFYTCSNCGFLFADSFEGLRYTTYYAGLNERYHEEHDQDNLRYSVIQQMLQPFQPSRILDWGCGKGTFLNRFPDGVDKYGVEVSTVAARQARNSNIHIVSLDEIKQGKIDHSVDAVTAIDVVEHISDLADFRDMAARILRPGGILAILTGNLDSLVARILGRYWYYIHYGEHISFLTEKAADKWLQTRFENIRITKLSHHKSSLLDLTRAFAVFPVAWILEKFGLAKKLRISARLYADSDHMLILASRRTDQG